MNRRSARRWIILGLLIAVANIGCSLRPAEAASSAAQGYAWGENLGWINAGATGGNLQVTDTHVTGFAWSRTYGWINFGPFTNAAGVANTTGGVLDGYAWSALGWIHMAGVVISPTGHFMGIANVNGTAAGRVAFNCMNCTVQTDWRPSTHPGGPAPGTGVPTAPAQAVVAAPPAPGSVVAAPAGNLFDVVAEPLFGEQWPWWIWWLVFLAIMVTTWLLLLYWLHWRHQRRLRRQRVAT